MPSDALIAIDGSWYKVGLRGMVFVFCDGEWLRSAKGVGDLRHSWKKEFMQLFVPPSKLPVCKKARAALIKEMKDFHSSLMRPFLDDGSWSYTPSIEAFARAYE